MDFNLRERVSACCMVGKRRGNLGERGDYKERGAGCLDVFENSNLRLAKILWDFIHSESIYDCR